MPETSMDPQIDSETMQTVFEVVREEYLSEERRHGLFVSKTQTLATASSIVFAGITASVFAAERSHWSYYLLFGAFALALASVFECVRAIRSKPFHRIPYAAPLQASELAKPAVVVMRKLAGSYRDAIDRSKEPTDHLCGLIDRSTWMLLGSLVFAGAGVVLRIFLSGGKV